MALFSTVRYTLCGTYIDFSSLVIPESLFSTTRRREAILWGKGNNGLLYFRIDEISLSHLPETETCLKLIKQSHIIIPQAAENGFLLLL
jgi:hypothetical protein